MTWTKSLPDHSGLYAWVNPEMEGLFGPYPGPCGGVCRVVDGQGQGWPVEDGKRLLATGSEIPEAHWLTDCPWLELPEVP